MSLEENSITIEDKEEEAIKSLFFDTYAFLEILKGNENYEKYSDVVVVATKLNLFELYLKIMREESEENADKVFEKYYPFTKDFDGNVIKEAVKLKMQINKRDISMTDCIGYCFSKQLGIKFLTGDKVFENMDDVEFAK